MNCETARTFLDAYSTNELDLASATEVEQHLAQCLACAKELEDLLAARQVERAIVALPGTGGFADEAERRNRSCAAAELLAICPDRRGDPAVFAAMPWLVRNCRFVACSAVRRCDHRQPCAVADGGSPAGCAIDRSAHGQAMVQRENRLFADGDRPGERRIPAAGRAGCGLYEWPFGCRGRLSARQAPDQRFRLAGRRI